MTKRGLIVDLHPAAFQYVQETFTNGYFAGQEHIVPSVYHKEGYQLPSFINPTIPKRKWGFGGNIRPITPIRKGWIAFVVAPPKYDPSGPPEEWYRPSASLDLLFSVLRFPRFQTAFDKPQLLTVTGVHAGERHYYSGALEAAISPPLLPWIEKFWVSRGETVRSAMHEMWNEIFPPRQKARLKDFYTGYNPPKWIWFDCPGNACGLGAEMAESSFTEENEGYTLVPHNTDQPGQQWSLLAGVAKIYELARADGF